MLRRVSVQGIVPLGQTTGPVIHGFTPLFLKVLTAIQLAASDCLSISSVDSRRRKSVNQGPKNGFLDSSIIAYGNVLSPLEPFVPKLLAFFSVMKNSRLLNSPLLAKSLLASLNFRSFSSPSPFRPPMPLGISSQRTPQHLLLYKTALSD